MKLPVDRLEAVAVHVRVVLRRADVGVAEHFLHGAQVGPAGQQVRREAVPQRVRADACRSAPPACTYFFTSTQSISRVSRRPPRLTNTHGASVRVRAAASPR